MSEIQWGIIAALVCLVVFLSVRLRDVQAQRPEYEAKCKEQFLELQIAYVKRYESHELATSGRIERLKVLMQEQKALQDFREGLREQRLADVEALLKRRLRPQS